MIPKDNLISVVMPCFNGAGTIADSIAAVFNQDYENLELVVVDDGSNDNSLDILNALSTEYPGINILSQSNKGPAAARNLGIRKALGEFIAFLDADDSWAPNCLSELIQPLLAGPEYVLSYCGWQNLGLSGGRGEPFVPPDYETPEKNVKLFTGCRWPIHAALTRRSAIVDAGGFDESLKACMDFDLWLRLGTARPVACVPKVLAYYHHHGGEQITKDRVRVALNHHKAQKKFLAENRDRVSNLSKRQVKEYLYGELLHRAYRSYWERDLKAARILFRKVMKSGYGSMKDWKYMLPSLLPMRAHKALIKGLGS